MHTAMNAVLKWKDTPGLWVVVITDGKTTIEMPFDDFLLTPAVKAAVDARNEASISAMAASRG
jgi:hypothetical protein